MTADLGDISTWSECNGFSESSLNIQKKWNVLIPTSLSGPEQMSQLMSKESTRKESGTERRFSDSQVVLKGMIFFFHFVFCHLNASSKQPTLKTFKGSVYPRTIIF